MELAPCKPRFCSHVLYPIKPIQATGRFSDCLFFLSCRPETGNWLNLAKKPGCAGFISPKKLMLSNYHAESLNPFPMKGADLPEIPGLNSKPKDSRNILYEYSMDGRHGLRFDSGRRRAEPGNRGYQSGYESGGKRNGA
jgi:hypothetical protein